MSKKSFPARVTRRDNGFAIEPSTREGQKLLENSIHKIMPFCQAEYDALSYRLILKSIGDK